MANESSAKPGRTLAAVREDAIKKAVKQVPRKLPPKERVARIKRIVEGGAAPTEAESTAKRTAPPADGWREMPLADGAVIEVVAKGNPYRGARAKRFIYAPHMTVKEALAKGATRPDIRWDAAKGFIKVKARARHR